MSRKQANKTFNYREEIDKLAARGITVLSAGADEVCGVYKDIDAVMAVQSDLVEAVARFSPKIVRMCGQRRPGRRLKILVGCADRESSECLPIGTCG
jgi:hypothetical protein